MKPVPSSATSQGSSQGLVGLRPALTVQLLLLSLFHLLLGGLIPILVLGLGRLQQCNTRAAMTASMQQLWLTAAAMNTTTIYRPLMYSSSC